MQAHPIHDRSCEGQVADVQVMIRILRIPAERAIDRILLTMIGVLFNIPASDMVAVYTQFRLLALVHDNDVVVEQLGQGIIQHLV